MSIEPTHQKTDVELGNANCHDFTRGTTNPVCTDLDEIVTTKSSNEFEMGVQKTSFDGSVMTRTNSIRMSKRSRQSSHSLRSTRSRSQADEIVRRGDAVRLTWKNVNVYAKPDVSIADRIMHKTGKAPIKGKQILQNVSGIAQPGNVLAIMGSSGAGKSTLLNALTWRNRQSSVIDGEVKINGHQLEDQISNVSAYVQQDDLFFGALTVREHLIFSAKLRMDPEVTEKERTKRVDEVMDQMGLRKCESCIIGTPGRTTTISGGERKRLSFASELLTNPPLMFCDEPTSGLDSYLAKVLCECLRAVAKQGTTVLCTIHQPSSEVFELFDQLLVLSLGRVVYMGPREQAKHFYNELGLPCPVNFNPADHYIMKTSVIPGDEKNCKEKIAEYADEYEKSFGFRNMHKLIDQNIDNEYRIEDLSLSQSRYKAGFLVQLMACLGRAMITTYRDPAVARTRFGQSVIIGVILGLVYLRTPFGKAYDSDEIQNLSGALFLVAINLNFSYVFNVLNVFPAEVPIFRREHFSGMYSTAAYFLSKNVAELPMYIIFPVVFDTIIYFMFGLYPSAAQFFIFCGICVLLANTCASFGYLISSLSPTVAIALTIGPPIMMPLILFGGFFLAADDIPDYFIWLKYLSWFLYTNEMMTINQWQYVDHINCVGPFNASCPVTTGNDVIESFDFDINNMGRDVGLMFALLVGYRLIAFFVLLFRMRDSTR